MLNVKRIRLCNCHSIMCNCENTYLNRILDKKTTRIISARGEEEYRGKNTVRALKMKLRKKRFKDKGAKAQYLMTLASTGAEYWIDIVI